MDLQNNWLFYKILQFYKYKQCHVKFYQSQRRISYIHVWKNTKKIVNVSEFLFVL